MIPFYQFDPIIADELLTDFSKYYQQVESVYCSFNKKHKASCRRLGTLHYFLKRNKRNEQIIWGSEIAVHERVIEQFEREGQVARS